MEQEPWSDEEDASTTRASKSKPATSSSTAAGGGRREVPPVAPLNASRVTAPMPVAYDSSGQSTTSAAARKYGAPSPVVNNKGRSKADFESILASGSDPSEEIRRSSEYAEWYYSQHPRDPRALAPLSGDTPPRHGPTDYTGGSPGEGGKPPMGARRGNSAGNQHQQNNAKHAGLSLDSGNFIPPGGAAQQVYAARGGINFNPYAATVSAYSIPSPGTQFYAQFAAQSPMVGTPGGGGGGVGAAAAALEAHMYAGTSPGANPYANHSGHAYGGGGHQDNDGTPPPGHSSPEEAAAIAAAQQALQQHHHHAAMMAGYGHHHHHQSFSPFPGGYPQHGNPYGAYGHPYSGAPVQLTPYPSTAGGQPGGAATSPNPQQHAQHPGYYPGAEMMAYGGYGGYYGGGQPTVNVGGMMMTHQEAYGNYPTSNDAGRGAGGGRGRGRGGGGPDRGGGGGGRGGRGGGRGGGAGGGQGGNAAPYVPRSETLERFRSTMGAGEEWKLEDIEGHAMEFARDQDGSRFIQRMLDTSPPAVVDRLFREIFASPVDLITDVFGNYVLQKLLEVGTHDQLLLVAESLRSQVVHLTLQTYGCRVVQKCIEVMPPRGLDIIIGELQGNVAKCIQDQNGNHVVQKCVEVVPDRCGFIVSAFTGRVKELATHAYGCRVIQCILQHCPAHEKEIFQELLQDIVGLTEDQYGNYVVQHVLQHATTEQGNEVFEKLKDHFYRFSVHKFASNVMERLFARCNDKQRSYIIDQLTREIDIGTQKEECADGKSRSPTQLFFMMKDQYANYVVQKVIDLCSDEHKRRLMVSTQSYIGPLRRYTFGKHMVARLERMKLLPLATAPTADAAGAGAGAAPAAAAPITVAE